ncbi:unnamed protein product [Clonostachys rosea]|uniref:Uncharacterized protein n=1 Tax=Bionectria ochroleuca TaxID=29856 RepID=A0ABY6UFS6_BIOOC|nr:unnamed protein product [Clonostachys rosea]
MSQAILLHSTDHGASNKPMDYTTPMMRLYNTHDAILLEGPYVMKLRAAIGHKWEQRKYCKD